MDDPWWFWFLRPFAELAGSLALILLLALLACVAFGCVVLYYWVQGRLAKRSQR